MSRIPSKCNFILTEKLQERVETLIEMICVVDSSFGEREREREKKCLCYCDYLSFSTYIDIMALLLIEESSF